jgi:hypothetical protein
MFHRHATSDADWDRIKDLLPVRPGQIGPGYIHPRQLETRGDRVAFSVWQRLR